MTHGVTSLAQKMIRLFRRTSEFTYWWAISLPILMKTKSKYFCCEFLRKCNSEFSSKCLFSKSVGSLFIDFWFRTILKIELRFNKVMQFVGSSVSLKSFQFQNPYMVIGVAQSDEWLDCSFSGLEVGDEWLFYFRPIC